MKHSDAIGKDWANQILTDGYTPDHKHSTTTEYKHWDAKTKKWKVKKITLKPMKLSRLNFNTRFVK